MDQQLLTDAARQFSQAAEQLVDACRKLESSGLPDGPIERLLQSLEEVTLQVHRHCPPAEQVRYDEPADLASPAAWKIAAAEAHAIAEWPDGGRG